MIQRPRTTVTPPAPPAYRQPGYYDYEEPPRGRSVWPWLLALGLIIAGGIGGWFLYTKIQDQLDSNKPVAVPDVLLLQKDLAKLKIEQAGLSAQIVKVTSDTVAPGQVADEDPPSGTKIGKGSTVTLRVSTGKPKVSVPNVVGQDSNSAVSALAGAGLQWKIRQVYSEQQEGTVTAQQPHAGDSVIKGSVVHINVSRGLKPVPVPDVTGQPYANAKSMLEGQGFQVTRAEVQSDQAQGVVVAEDPPQGSSVPRGTTIRLSVSKGPATTQVPDVTGQSQSAAESLLSGAGLTPSVVYDPVTDPAQDGIVTSTDPAPGSDAKSGEVVIMHVGQLQQGGGQGGGGGTTTTTSSP